MIARSRFFIVLAAVLAWALSTPAHAADAKISDFYGEYIGTSMSAGTDGMSERDLGVKIGPAEDDGFRIDWTTFTRGGADSRDRRKSYSIEFIGSGRPGIYASAMKKDKFGSRKPLDPLKGEPFVWAKIGGKTLTVYALIITENGGYEMQVYERSLTPAGLDLKFSRFRDGETFKVVTAALLKFKK